MASSKINIDLVLNTKGFRPLGRINGQLGEFEKSLDASNARVLAFGASAGAILAVRKALTATVKAAIEVEKSLQDINVILQATSSNLKKFGSDLFQIASQTGQSFQVAAEAAAELARQGLGTAETLKRTKDALILARLSGMGAAEAVNSLTAAINTFNKAGLDSTTIINKLANVDAAFAVSSDDLAKALGRVGSSAQGAGVSLDQLLAIVTTVQQKTARGGAVIGNSFKTIFTRIQRPRVIQELENLGVAVRDVEGEVLPAIKVLSNLAKQFDNLSSSQRSQITELVGGVFQVNILKSAMSDLSKETGIYNRALGISLGSSDQALKRNEELNKTLAAQFQRTVNTFKEGAAELGQLTFAPSLERLFGIVEGFEKLGQTDGGKIGGAIAKSIFEGIGNFISGPGLLIIGFTLFKTFSQLGKFASDAFKTLTGLNKNFQTQLNIQKQIFNVLEENPDLLRKIKDGTLSVEDAHQEIFNQINKNTSALEEQLRMSQRLAQGLSGSGVGFDSEFGAFTGGRRPRFGASGGYAPNFADEVAGMIASGYSKAQVRNPKVRRQQVHDGMGGSFSTTVNGHEDIINTTNSSGKKATFVVPPRNTNAYRNYMSSLSSGFIPNFEFSPEGGITKEEIEELKRLYNLPKIKQPIGAPTYSEATKTGMYSIAKRILPPSFTKGGKLSQSVGKVYETAVDKYDKQESIISARASGDVTGYGKPVDFATRKAKGVQIYNAGNQVGLLGLYGQSSSKGYVEASRDKITEIKDFLASITDKRAKKQAERMIPSRIGFRNVELRSLTKELEDNKQKGEFSRLVRKNLSEGMFDLANDFSTGILGNDALKSAKIADTGAPLFSVSAEGNIFETAVNALTTGGKNRAKSFEAALAADQQQVWDFEERGTASGRFKNAFDFSDSIIKADAKRTLSKGAGESMVNKIFNTPSGTLQNTSWVDDLINVKRSFNAASGFIPNFSALFESVRREKEAGVPAGRIRIGQSDRLKNGANPAGFGIYNTRDEPMGLNQGINNSVAAGIDPKKQGMFNGFVPNFIAQQTGMIPTRKNEVAKVSTAVAKTSKEITKGHTEGFKRGAKFYQDWINRHIDGMKRVFDNAPAGAGGGGGGGGGRRGRAVPGGEESSGGKKGRDKKRNEAVTKNTKATMDATKGLLALGLLEQGASALRNSIDDNNTIAKSLINSITTLIATGVALKYALQQAKDGMGITAGRGTREGTRQRRRFGEGIQSFGRRQQRLGSRMGRDSVGNLSVVKRTRRSGMMARAGRGIGAVRGLAGRGIASAGGSLAGGMASGALAAAGGAALGGLAIGKVLGNLFSESDLDPTFKAARDAGKAFERIKEATEKNIGSLNSFATATEQAAKVYGDSNSTMTQVVNASKKVEKEMEKLPNEFRQKLAGIADPDMINNLVQQFTAKEQEKAATAGQSKFAADTLRSSRNFGAAEFFNSPFSSTFNALMPGVDAMGRTEEDIKLNDQNIEQVGKNIIQSSIGALGAEQFQGTDFNKVFRDVAAIDIDDEAGRKEALAEGLGLDPDKNAAELKVLADIFNEGGDQAKTFFESLSKNTLQLQADLEVRKAMEPAQKAFIKANREAEKEIRKQKKALESEQRIRKEVIKISSQAAKAFMTEVGSIKLDNINKVNELQADTARKFGSSVSEVQTALSKTDGALGGDLESSTKALLSRASSGGVGSVTQQQADAQAEKIQQKIEELRGSNDPIQKAQADKLEATKIAIENLGGTSERMSEELKNQTREIQEQTKAQIAAARQAQRLRSFGGTQALLDPSKLNTQLTQIRSGGQAMAMSAAAGSQTGFNRGRINQLAAMQELMGGELPEGAAREARARAEQVKFSDISKMNQALGLGLSQDQIRKTAAEQAANLFKGDPEEQNTKALESLNTTLKEGIKFISAEGEGRIKINDMQNRYASARGRAAQRNLLRGQELQRGFSGIAGINAEGIAAMDRYAHEGVTGADYRNYAASYTAAGAGLGAGISAVTGPGMVLGTGLGAGTGFAVANTRYAYEKLTGPTEEGIRTKYAEHMKGSQGELDKFQKMIQGEGGETTNNTNTTTINFPQGPNSDPVIQGGEPNADAVAAAGNTLTSMANRLKRLETVQQQSTPSLFNQTAPA